MPQGQESTCSPSAADEKSAGNRQFSIIASPVSCTRSDFKPSLPKAVTNLQQSDTSGSALSPQDTLHSCAEVTDGNSADVLLIISGAGGTAAYEMENSLFVIAGRVVWHETKQWVGGH